MRPPRPCLAITEIDPIQALSYCTIDPKTDRAPAHIEALGHRSDRFAFAHGLHHLFAP
jgi:hypothetical protein